MRQQKLTVAVTGSATEFAPAFASLAQKQVGALLVDGDPFFDMHAGALVELASKYALPAIYSEPEYVTAGGLASCGPDILEAYRQVGLYAGRILRGEKPADLPVVQLSKVEFTVNLKQPRPCVSRSRKPSSPAPTR